MSSRQNAVLEKLAKHHYIQWVAIFSNEAELLNQPIGQWSGGDDINILVGKILYTNSEANTCLNQGNVRQLWLTLEQGYFICTYYSPEEILVINANNNGFLGELRQKIDLTIKSLQQILQTESDPFASIFTHQKDTEENGFGEEQKLMEERSTSSEADTNKNSQGKLRGRTFIE